MTSQRPFAFVSNAGGYAGPPAVEALTGAGFEVFAHDASAAAGDPVAPGPVHRLAGDVADALDAAWERAGRIDVIVSNDHHPALHRPSEEVPLADLEDTLRALVVRPFAALQRAIPRLKRQGGGQIIMITSCRTALPMPGGAVPDMARAAGNALVRALAIELAPFEIAVNAIAPNFLYSEAYYPRARFIDDPAGAAFVKASVPAGRLGRPQEIGEIIAFLATTKARFLTGAIIDFSGGWPASPPRPSTTGETAD